MDNFSLTFTSRISLWSPTGKLHSNTATTASSSTIAFSLKPPPPPSPPPPPESTDSSSLRRPKSLIKPTTTTTTNTHTASTPTSKIPRNPLKSLVNPSVVSLPPPSPPPPTDTLSTKLRLSSRLSPPPPPPPPPPPYPVVPPSPAALQEAKIQENESQRPEFRQEGKIFVGNLPNWIKKHELSEFFRQFGPIKNVILIKGHHETERNAGFGFIIYDGQTAEKSAMKAVEFDGMEFHGRILTVKLDDGRRLKAKAEERKK